MLKSCTVVYAIINEAYMACIKQIKMMHLKGRDVPYQQASLKRYVEDTITFY